MQPLKGRDNWKAVPNLSYSNNLVKIRVGLGVFRHAQSKSGLYSMFLVEVLVILCWNPRQLFQISETRHTFGQNWAVQFCRITLFLQTIRNAQILDSFEKKESKKNKQWFWDQNRNQKYSKVMKQSNSKPDWEDKIVITPHKVKQYQLHGLRL